MLSVSMMVNGLEGFCSHDCLNLLETDGSKTVAIHAHINRSGIRVILEGAVTMPKKVPCSVVALVPHSHGVMSQSNLLTPTLYFPVAVRKSVELRSVSPRQSIVVSFYEDDAATQSLEVAVKVLVVSSKRKIAKMVNQVIRSNNPIPVGNNRFIHFNHILKWPMAVTDYISVAKVGVSSKECIHTSR